MTIGELEAALDMPRANIRFMSRRASFTPGGGEQLPGLHGGGRGYPAQSEAAAAARTVPGGDPAGPAGRAPSGGPAGEQEAALARRRAELDWAGQVCRAMREDGVEFATLDAHRYLSRLDRPADQPGFFDLRADAAPHRLPPLAALFRARPGLQPLQLSMDGGVPVPVPLVS